MAETPEQFAKFLKKWSKGKTIRQMPGSEFHSAGRWTTRITPAQIKGLTDAGLATYERGVLTLKSGG